MEYVVESLLDEFSEPPVLVDIGAAGGTPKMWKDIAKHSTYLGFDPLLRDIRYDQGSIFMRSIIVNSAVVADPKLVKVKMYLTREPECSSTLCPNMDNFGEYLYSKCFIVEDKREFPAITLNKAIGNFGLKNIDFLKLDSQGTDLRIIKSLDDKYLDKILAIEVEPSIRPAYEGEDSFPETHRFIIEKGFWPYGINLQSNVRSRRRNLCETLCLKEDEVDKYGMCLEKAPTAVKARYFRSIDSLLNGNFVERDFLLIWVFASSTGQFGYALDLAITYENHFGDSEEAYLMYNATVDCIRKCYRRKILVENGKRILTFIQKRGVYQFLKRVWGRGNGYDT